MTTRTNTAKRDRKAWSSPSQAKRGRPNRAFNLPPDVHAALDALRVRCVNLSSLGEEALRAHPLVAAELERIKKNDTTPKATP